MERRVYGLETEYALSFEAKDRRLRSPDPGALFNHLEEALLSHYLTLESDSFGRDPNARRDDIEIREGRFLESGARFYYDTGHAEWATPETTTPQQAVLYELAGERTLIELARSILLPHGGRLLLVKNNVDYMHGTTYGCHENYQVQRSGSGRKDKAFFQRLVQQLVPFLVTRQIFCGAGKVGCTDPRAARHVGYQISQRADFIENVMSKETRSERAIINARDESLGDEKRYRRLHLIVGDSNMSPYANILKLGTTGTVLRLIEEGALENVPVLADPVEAIKAVSRDLTCQQPLLLQDGRKLSPIKLQKAYLEQAQRFFETRTADEATRQILEMWRCMLDDLAIDPMRLADRVDWVIKYRYLLEPQLTKARATWPQVAAWSHVIENLQRENGSSSSQGSTPSAEQYARYQHFINQYQLNWGDYTTHRRLYFDLRERDLRYHDVDPEHSLFYALQEAGLVAGVFDDTQVMAAQRQPPQDTRARLRAEVIRWAHREGRAHSTSLDWGRIEFTAPRRTVRLDDPFTLTQQEVDRHLKGEVKPEVILLRPDEEEEILIRILSVEEVPREEKDLIARLKRLFKR